MPVYADLNQSTPGKANSQLVIDEASVEQAIENLINTRIGSRMFNPLYGCDLQSWLFETMGPDTEYGILNAVIVAINTWEPRVSLRTDLSTIEANYATHSYKLTLVYELRGLSQNHITQIVSVSTR